MSRAYVIALCGPAKCGKTELALALQRFYPEIERRSLKLPGATQARAQLNELAKSGKEWQIVTIDDVITIDTLKALKKANDEDVARVYRVRVVGDSETGALLPGCAEGMDIRDVKLEEFDYVVDTRCRIGSSRDAHLDRLATAIGAAFDFDQIIKNQHAKDRQQDVSITEVPTFFLVQRATTGNGFRPSVYVDQWPLLAPIWRQILELRQTASRIGSVSVISMPRHDVTDAEILTALQEHYGTDGVPPK